MTEVIGQFVARSRRLHMRGPGGAFRARRRALCGLIVLAAMGCSRTDRSTPEGVADLFVDAYFRQADQERAKAYTAFGASKMLERELADVEQVRKDGYSPTAASIEVAAHRGSRTMRGDRVRFDYRLRFRSPQGERERHADIELTKVHGDWKVVRVTLTSSTPAAATTG